MNQWVVVLDYERSVFTDIVLAESYSEAVAQAKDMPRLGGCGALVGVISVARVTGSAELVGPEDDWITLS